MTPLRALEGWLATTLAAQPSVVSSAGGRVFADAVPQGQSLPAVVFRVITGDHITTQGDRGGTLYLVEIRAVAISRSKDLVHQLAEDIDALRDMHDDDGAYEFNSVCIEDITTRVESEGEIEVSAGALFEIWVRKLTA